MSNAYPFVDETCRAVSRVIPGEDRSSWTLQHGELRSPRMAELDTLLQHNPELMPQQDEAEQIVERTEPCRDGCGALTVHGGRCPACALKHERAAARRRSRNAKAQRKTLSWAAVLLVRERGRQA